MIKSEVNNALEVMFNNCHKLCYTKSGDITSEQSERLKKIQNEIQKLIIEQVTQNL